MKKKSNKKEIIRRIILVIAIITLVVSGYKLFSIWNEYHKNAKTYDEVREYSPQSNSDEGTEDPVEKYRFKQEDFDKLFNINNDFKGWITVPNTNVDYPIVQTTDNEYYLHHNFKKEYNEGGAIFIASENSNPFKDENTVIHGHHMRDGSMFASLEKYKDKSFLDSNNKIYITTKDNVYEYEIFSVYVIEANSNPYKINLSSGDEYVKYLNELKNSSMYQIDTPEFTKDDRIITLSTCSYEVEDGRLLVHGRLVK